MGLRLPPRRVAAGLRLRAAVRAGWVLAALVLLEHAIVTIEYLVRLPGPAPLLLSVVSVASVAITLALVVLYPGLLTGCLHLAVGAVAIGVYIVIIGGRGAHEGDILILGAIGTALCLVGAVTGGALSGLAWTVAGMVVGQTAVVGTQAAMGLPLQPDIHALIIGILYCGTYLLMWRTDRLLDRVDETDATADAERGEQQVRLLRRDAVVVHETVLRDLALIAHTPGPVGDHDRERLRLHVTQLRRWANRSEDADPATTPREAAWAADAEHATDLYTVIREFQWKGLSIDIGGAAYALDLLAHADRDALIGAVRAALDNVLEHSGETDAEVFIDRTPGFLTVMVVDEGVGFDPDGVADDRLGIRMTITRRMEDHGGSATLWSSRGEGTSVILALPLDDDTAPAEDA